MSTYAAKLYKKKQLNRFNFAAKKVEFAIAAGNLGLDSQRGEIGYSVANGSSPPPRFLELCCPGARSRRGPRHSLHQGWGTGKAQRAALTA